MYGNSIELRRGLIQMNNLFVMDTDEDHLVYLQRPKRYVPKTKLGRGRPNSSFVSDVEPAKIKHIIDSLKDTQWKNYTLRQGTKGPMKRQVVCLQIYDWKARHSKTDHVEPLRLIISRNEEWRPGQV